MQLVNRVTVTALVAVTTVLFLASCLSEECVPEEEAKLSMLSELTSTLGTWCEEKSSTEWRCGDYAIAVDSVGAARVYDVSHYPDKLFGRVECSVSCPSACRVTQGAGSR